MPIFPLSRLSVIAGLFGGQPSLSLLQRARLAEDQLRARARELAALVIGAHAPVHPWRDCCAKLIFTRIASGSALRETV